jgi:hypothetical protein
VVIWSPRSTWPRSTALLATSLTRSCSDAGTYWYWRRQRESHAPQTQVLGQPVFIITARIHDAHYWKSLKSHWAGCCSTLRDKQQLRNDPTPLGVFLVQFRSFFFFFPSTLLINFRSTLLSKITKFLASPMPSIDTTFFWVRYCYPAGAAPISGTSRIAIIAVL